MQPFRAAFRGFDCQGLERVRFKELAGLFGLLGLLAIPGRPP